MTNKNIQSLKKFIKLKNVIDMIPVDINNCPEKLSGKLVRGKKRQFSIDELSLIEEALIAIADHIKSFSIKTTGRGTR